MIGYKVSLMELVTVPYLIVYNTIYIITKV